MTTTVQEIVRGALILIGVQDIGEAVSAEDGADGLIAFNDMVASWDANGVHTGAAASALTSDSPLEERHTKGLKNLLAVELASAYGRAIPQKVAHDAQEGWQLIEADFKMIEKLSMDPGYLSMPSQRRCW
jgi:hypothetical protein